MANTNLRKVKEVNGWKINHPHSGANVFNVFLTLILAAVPVAFIFLPLVILFDISDPSIHPSVSFNGIGMVSFVVHYVIYLINGTEIPAEYAIFGALADPAFAGQMFAPAMPYLFLAAGGILAIMTILSVILVIIFLVYLIKGYLKHSGVIKGFAVAEFIFSLLLSIIFLVEYMGFAGSEASTGGTHTLFVWWPLAVSGGYLVLLIIISVVYAVNFQDSIPETELEYHDDAPSVEHVSKVHEVTKVKYEQSSELPPNLTSIGGHAFAENQNLIVANIPLEVSKIGNSAFANCLNLKVVSIPETVTEIGFNCFFNCVALERINYSGTKENWKKIKRGSNWLAKAGITEVTCVDGVIIVNPYH